MRSWFDSTSRKRATARELSPPRGLRWCNGSPHPSFGALAHPGERLFCKQEVTSSILVGSTRPGPSLKTAHPAFVAELVYAAAPEAVPFGAEGSTPSTRTRRL